MFLPDKRNFPKSVNTQPTASGGQGVKREAGKKREVGKLGKRGEIE